MKRALLFFVIILASMALAQAPDSDLDKAMQGDPAAQVRLAKAYQFGDGQAKDMHEAVRWFRAAAAKGNAEAAYILGTLAYNGDALGDNVRQSDIDAWVWFRIAQEDGYADAADAVTRTESEFSDIKLLSAHEKLASVFINGGSVPPNPAAAVRELSWLEQHESRQGTYLLGRVYLEGRGVPKDVEKAQALCQKAATQGVAGAYSCLAEIYDSKGDAKTAFDCIKKDAERGFATATLNLIDRYHAGIGTQRDPVMALAWAIAAERGQLKKGFEDEEKITAELTEKQRKEAKKKAEKLQTPFTYTGLKFVKR